MTFPYTEQTETRHAVTSEERVAAAVPLKGGTKPVIGWKGFHSCITSEATLHETWSQKMKK